MANAETARLIASLELKDQFSNKLGAAERSLGSFDRRLGQTEGRAFKAGQQIGTGIKRVAAASVGLAIAGGTVFAKALGDASDLNETVSKVGVVFGKNAKQVLAFGKDSASALGLSENAALAAAGTYGNLFVSLGLTSGKAAKMSTTMVKLAGDLASFNNASPEDTLLAIQAGLVGETEPLRKYGINLNDATLRQEAMRLGLTKTTKEVLPPAIKAQAAYSLILKQSGTAQGDFKRTSGGMANQIRILKANFTDMLATLAAPALPGVAKIFQNINKEIKANQPAIAGLAEKIGGLFTDANIKTGFDAIKQGFQIAKDAAPAIADAAKITGSALKIAVDAFKSLPKEVQQIAIAGLAVNKLTGGLVTNIAGGIIDTVGKQFLQRGGTPANPLFVSDVTGGLGGAVGAAEGAAGGGIGGLIKGGVKFILPVAAGIAIANAIKEVTGTTDAQQQQAQTHGQFGPRSASNVPLKVTIDPSVAATIAGERREALRDAFGDSIGKGVAAVSKYLSGANGKLDILGATFRAGLAGLKTANSPAQIKAAVSAAIGAITKGRGNAGNTGEVLNQLKRQLKNTHDPVLARILRSAIGKVESKLPGRQFAARELALADQTLRSSKTSAQKIEALKTIERQLKDHGLPQAASRIREKIEQAKKAQVAAEHATKAAVDKKDLSVKVINNVSTSVSIRDLGKTTRVLNRYSTIT